MSRLVAEGYQAHQAAHYADLARLLSFPRESAGIDHFLTEQTGDRRANDCLRLGREHVRNKAPERGQKASSVCAETSRAERSGSVKISVYEGSSR